MASVTLKIFFELEGEDVSDETMRSLELQCAMFSERLEMRLIDDMQRACPGLKITAGGDDLEDECNL